ncbi:hypothetical protein LINPERPRIM_LOCUS32879 [Linum perenne]
MRRYSDLSRATALETGLSSANRSLVVLESRAGYVGATSSLLRSNTVLLPLKKTTPSSRPTLDLVTNGLLLLASSTDEQTIPSRTIGTLL